MFDLYTCEEILEGVLAEFACYCVSHIRGEFPRPDPCLDPYDDGARK